MSTVRKKKLATIPQMAAMNFEPAVLPDAIKRRDLAHHHLTAILLGMAALTKTKDELIELWKNHKTSKASKDFVNGLIAAQKWLKATNSLMETAEVRMMCAAASAERASIQRRQARRRSKAA